MSSSTTTDMITWKALDVKAETFVPHSGIHSRVTTSCNLLHIPQCRLSSGQCRFRHCRCKLWNNLPNDLHVVENVGDFRRRLLNRLLSGKITH